MGLIGNAARRIAIGVGLVNDPRKEALADAESELAKLKQLKGSLKIFIAYVAKAASDIEQAKVERSQRAGVIYGRANNLIGNIESIRQLERKEGVQLIALVHRHLTDKETKQEFNDYVGVLHRQKENVTLLKLLRNAVNDFRKMGNIRAIYHYFNMMERVVETEIPIAQSVANHLKRIAA